MNPNPTYYKREKLSGNRTAFMFETLTDVDRFIDETQRIATGNAANGFNRLNDPNYVASRLNRYAGNYWFGTRDINLIQGRLNNYLFNNQLESFLDTFRNSSINIDIIDIDQQKAIKFTEKEIGIFSFDLASLGLIRVFEYYSPLLKRIVSPNLIISQKNEQGQLIFYHVYMPYIPTHRVEYDVNKGGYYSGVLNRVVSKDALIEVVTDKDIYLAYPETPEIPQHVVEQRQQVDENGRKKFSSTFKRSFIDIPKVEKSLPRVDIIVPASYPWTKNAETEVIYNSMAAIAIAEKLSKSGVNFRIIAAFSNYLSSSMSSSTYSFIQLKKEGDPFDKNKIAIFLSDGRLNRLKGFKILSATAFDSGYDSDFDDSAMGLIISDADTIKTAYIDYLKLQNNPEDKKAAENPRSKVVFNGAFSQQDAIDEYNRVIQEISRI